MWDWYGRYLRGASSSWISRTGDGCRFLGGVTGVAGITPSGAVDDPCCRSGTFPDEDSGKDVVAENVYSVQLRRIRAGAVYRFAPGLIYVLTGRLFSRPVSWSRLQKKQSYVHHGVTELREEYPFDVYLFVFAFLPGR